MAVESIAVVDCGPPLPRVIEQLTPADDHGAAYQARSSVVINAAFGEDFGQSMCVAAQIIALCLWNVRMQIGASRTAVMIW